MIQLVLLFSQYNYSTDTNYHTLENFFITTPSTLTSSRIFSNLAFYNTSTSEFTYSANANVVLGTSSTIGGSPIGYLNIPQVSFAANATTALSDAGKHYYSTTGTTQVLTIPLNSSVAFPIGTAITVINQGVGSISLAPTAGVSLYLAGSSLAGARTLATYGFATLVKVGTDTWFVNGTGLS